MKATKKKTKREKTLYKFTLTTTKNNNPKVTRSIVKGAYEVEYDTYGKMFLYNDENHNCVEVMVFDVLMGDVLYSLNPDKKTAIRNMAKSINRTIALRDAETSRLHTIEFKLIKSIEEPKKKFHHYCEYFDCESNENGYCWDYGWPAEDVTEPCYMDNDGTFSEITKDNK